MTDYISVIERERKRERKFIHNDNDTNYSISNMSTYIYIPKHTYISSNHIIREIPFTKKESLFAFPTVQEDVVLNKVEKGEDSHVLNLY